MDNKILRNEGYYFRYPTGRHPYKQIVIPDLEAFKARIERLEAIAKGSDMEAYRADMEAISMKLVLALYEKQEEGQNV